MNRKMIAPCIFLGFASYLFGEYIILVRMKAMGWGALAFTGCFTAFWLLLYTQFIGATAVELHEERKRKETLLMSDDINKETDKMLRETRLFRKIPAWFATFCFISWLAWRNIKENLFREDEDVDPESID